MARKTYVPTLIFLIKKTIHYIRKYQLLLQANTTDEQFTCVMSVCTTLETCLPNI